jgi:hypothetical protein
VVAEHGILRGEIRVSGCVAAFPIPAAGNARQGKTLSSNKKAKKPCKGRKPIFVSIPMIAHVQDANLEAQITDSLQLRTGSWKSQNTIGCRVQWRFLLPAKPALAWEEWPVHRASCNAADSAAPPVFKASAGWGSAANPWRGITTRGKSRQLPINPRAFQVVTSFPDCMRARSPVSLVF